MMEENKKNKEIKIDTEFLGLISDSIKSLKNEMDLIKKELENQKEILNQNKDISDKKLTLNFQEKDYIFFSSEVLQNNPAFTGSPQDIQKRQEILQKFREQLERLMVEFKILRLEASLNKKF